MGFSPMQVDQMSLWQFMAVSDGYRAANGGKPQVEQFDDDELGELGIEGF